ncbi:MAG: YqhA family protein [Chitinophagaceae bacterium]|nr:YqhA family protein [Chitinophagaceae bacterium]MCW5925669.1 YqhA family protein [Chitinophagaceae bacterium]
MRKIYNFLKLITSAIAVLIFISGTALALLGCYHFIIAWMHVNDGNAYKAGGLIAIELLSTVDILLIAIVLLVFSIGILILFHDPAKLLPVRLPEWLRIKNFMQLKIILWEAILTTLVIGYLTGLAEARLNGDAVHVRHLIIPGGILLISLSLYLLKKGEK